MTAAGVLGVGAEAPPSPLDARCEAVCARVASCLEGALRDLQLMSKSFTGVRLDSRTAEDLLRDTVEMYQDSNGLMLIGTDGVVVAVSPGVAADRVGQSLEDSHAWRRMQAEQDAVLYESPPGLADRPAWAFLIPLSGSGQRWQGALQLNFYMDGLFGAVCRELKHEHPYYEVFLPSGQVVFESGGAGAQGGIVADDLHARMLTEKSGHRQCTLLDAESGALSTRETAWMHYGFRGLEWIIACGEERPFDGGGTNGLTGRWMGAYSEKRASVAGDEEDDQPRSGQLNFTILQEGGRIELWTAARGVAGLARGVFADGRLSAALVRPSPEEGAAVWYWQAEYDREGDVLKGSIRGNALDAVVERAFHVRRAPAGP
ncbi:MAG: cache domain-containing protein [Kiritimatiellae bacterium]|nr:cache domain-containing protein [Kiritimatiellia bacterium]